MNRFKIVLMASLLVQGATCLEAKADKNPQAIGFICRNQSQKGRKKTEFVNSVDEVERITGYDFFPQLPDDVEKRVEAKAEMF